MDRPNKRGGGITCIYRSAFTIGQFQTKALSFCEYLGLEIWNDGKPCCNLHAIYHSPRDNQTFMDQTMEIITSNSDLSASHIFLGDFNIHWNNDHDPFVSSFKDFLTDLNLIQACNIPTHTQGATRDLIIANDNAIRIESILPCDWSDHSLISFQI